MMSLAYCPQCGGDIERNGFTFNDSDFDAQPPIAPSIMMATRCMKCDWMSLNMPAFSGSSGSNHPPQ